MQKWKIGKLTVVSVILFELSQCNFTDFVHFNVNFNNIYNYDNLQATDYFL